MNATWGHDQPPFRRLLYESGLKQCLLEPSFNRRFPIEIKKFDPEAFDEYIFKLNKMQPFHILHDRPVAKRWDKIQGN
jgi:hypothetical protein